MITHLFKCEDMADVGLFELDGRHVIQKLPNFFEPVPQPYEVETEDTSVVRDQLKWIHAGPCEVAATFAVVVLGGWKFTRVEMETNNGKESHRQAKTGQDGESAPLDMDPAPKT